jgi:hypothetical protein
MKKLNYSAFGFFTLITTFFIISCASEPVRVKMPANHPANPQSEETAFMPPPNPFQNNTPTAEQQAGSSSSMSHEKHLPAQEHQMDPKMNKMSNDPGSSHTSEAQDPEHEDKEHHQ